MKIAIFGKAHAGDYPKNWDVRLCPSLADMAEAVRTGDEAMVDGALQMVGGVDVAIYSLLGANLSRIMPILTNDEQGKKIFAVKRRAAWSVDSHHWAGPEHEWAKHFTSLYSSYPKRLGVKAYFLPPAVWDLSAGELAALEVTNTPPPISITCLMRPYWNPKTARNHTLQRMIPIFRKYHLSFLAGQSEPYSSFLMILRNSQVGLNISLDGELNSRCLEVMAMGRVLLTNRFREPEMNEYLKEFGDAVVFYNPDLSDFEPAMSEALLRVPSKDTRKIVAERHCLVHRHMEIAKNEASDEMPVALQPGT